MVSARYQYLLLVTLLWAGSVHAEPVCAGDGVLYDWETGQPFVGTIAVSTLLSARVLPYRGADLALRRGDPGDARTSLSPGTARLAVCGRLQLRRGELRYHLAYAPYDVVEAAHADAAPYGRILAAEVGYPLWRWLAIYAGIRRVAFSFGHDEPEQSLALPLRPYLSSSLAPDRRLGLTLDNNWGPARVIVGLYESARTFAAYPQSTIVVTARGALEPLGPVGRSISTLADDSYWRRRARFAFNLSMLLDWAPRGDLPLGFVIGGDLPFKYGPLGLVVEYLYARSAPFEDPSVPPGLRADRQGLWAQAALMVLRPYLELEGRYEWFDVPADERQRFHALTAGLSGYVLSDRIKAQAAYGRKFHYAGPALRDDYLLLLLQIVD
ncbi:MAG TPA: hypothetical protein PLW65_06215 [Pseudomonadota bacterium]|nr:hypothetical protein [Pseudomonadota bacterium]HRI49759.1 hypothetical protein [Pseudomonadota bacterium]